MHPLERRGCYPFPSFSNCWSVDCYIFSFRNLVLLFLKNCEQNDFPRDVSHTCVGKPIIYSERMSSADVMRAFLHKKEEQRLGMCGDRDEAKIRRHIEDGKSTVCSKRATTCASGTHNIFVIAISSRFRGSVQKIARSLSFFSLPSCFGCYVNRFKHFHSSSKHCEQWWLDCYWQKWPDIQYSLARCGRVPPTQTNTATLV